MRSNESSKVPKLPGRRASRTRRIILDTLNKIHCGTVEELLNAFPQPRLPHKTTIYRELECLISNRLARQLDFGDGRKRYELTSDEHHHHLICTACGSTQPIRIKDNLTKKILPTAINHGFTVTDYALEFFGFCKKCLPSTS